MTGIQPLPANTPTFRRVVYEAAERVTLVQSAAGKWVDVLAHRGADLVYITTFRNEKEV
jgi:hypothetical protein